MKRIRASFLGFALAFLLFGCDDNNDSSLSEQSSTQTASPNISLASIGPTQKSTYLKGEPISINFSVASSKISANNILINFSLVPVNELEKLEAREETSAKSIGDYLIESIRPGVAYLQADLVIPNDLVGGQDFVILGVVDPEGSISDDANFADNLSRNFDANFTDPTTKVIKVSDAFINDLSIEKAEVGQGFILLETPSSPFSNNQLPTNVVTVADDPRESNAIGHIDVKKLGSDSMSAIIQVDVIVAGEETAAFMWKGENDEWVNEAPYDVPSPNEVHFVPWDIRLSSDQRAALFAAYDTTSSENIATFRFRIQQTSGALDENPKNNTFELDVPFRFFTPNGEPDDPDLVTTQAAILSKHQADDTFKSERKSSKTDEMHHHAFEISAASSSSTNSGAFTFDRSYSQTYGDKKKFAVRLKSKSVNKVNGPQGTGRIYNTATIDAYALGKKIQLARAFGNAEARVGNANASAGYHGYIKVFENVVLDQSKSKSTDISREWSLSWRERKTFARATFFAGPIPITIEAGATGTVGFGAGLAISEGVIEGYGDLFFAELDAYAEGGVDIGIASGGIRAELLLLEHRFRVSGIADLSQISNRRVTLNALAQNKIKAIKGKFYLFARYPYFKFCCAIKRTEKRLTLYQTGALFNKNWNLLNESRAVTF